MAAATRVATPVSTVRFTVERLLDRVGQWLSGLPGGPVTDLLSGALWAVRRTLFPVGDGVGQWGTAACVATGDCSGQDLSGADLSGQDLTGYDLSEANLTGANLARAKLANATLADANLDGADLSGADLSRADLSGAVVTKYTDLLGVQLEGANLTGVNLSGRNFFSGVTAKLYDVNLTNADLRGSDLSNVILINANLTNVDLTRTKFNTRTRLDGANLTAANLAGRDLSGVDFTGATLANATLINAQLTKARLSGARLLGANLTGANLVDATLTGADLTGANLTGADLYRADLLNTTLTRVVWSDTNCQYGGKTSTGCSNVPPPSEPPASWLQQASAGGSKWQWYQYDGTATVPEENTTPMVRGTQGAPLQNVNFKAEGYGNDGVQGVIYNDSDQRVVVRTLVAMNSPSDYSCCANVILDPGGSVSYQFEGDQVYDDDVDGTGQGQIEFLRYDNGEAVGDVTALWLADHSILRPSTEFTPPGHTEPNARRKNWKEEEQHSEIWGSVRIDVKRERDGYRVEGSDTFNAYYPDPNDVDTGDWAIFTIRIKSL